MGVEVCFNVRDDVLKALLVESSRATQFCVPARPEFIMSEIANGTIAHVGGDAGKQVYRGCPVFGPEFELLMNEEYDAQLARAPRKLVPSINSAIKALIEEKEEWAPPERPYFSCRTYPHFRTLRPSTGKSTWELSYSLVRTGEKLLNSGFSNEEKNDLIGIAEKMKPFLREDLAHIRRNYRW
ncbi:hypothetical protein HY489_04760 [Candidatus Woesearchaeota archaeon]|nr:hypothetical protein [Candidatus Woesearchaeota archaeon]